MVRRMLVTQRPSAAAAVMTAAEGAEGAAADVAVGGLLERRRRLHGPTAPAACSGSGPELACLTSAIYGGGDGENRRPTR